MLRYPVRALAALAVAAFALAACGSSSKSSTSASTDSTTVAPTTTVAPPTTVAATSTASVTLASTKLGKVLVDAKGMTLYQFDNDTKPDASTCGAGQCASTWPAATVTGAATAGPGVTAALTSFTRTDGGKQLQIAGHPLYTFAGDAKPGDTNGQKVIDKWYATDGAGKKVGDD